MYIYPYIMKREWLKNNSNYFVTCKYFRLILESLQTVKNVYMHIYIYIYTHKYNNEKKAIIYNKYSANLNKRYLQGLCKQQ